MYRWLKEAQSPNLPRPVSPLFTSVNKHVNECMAGSSEGKRKRKREYNRYTPQQRAEIAEYARVHGNTKAAKHFSEKLNMCIDESSVRNMKKTVGTVAHLVHTTAPPFRQTLPLLSQIHVPTWPDITLMASFVL